MKTRLNYNRIVFTLKTLTLVLGPTALFACKMTIDSTQVTRESQLDKPGPEPTPIPSVSPTPSPTSSASPSPTPTRTASPTPSPSPTPTATPTPTPTPTGVRLTLSCEEAAFLVAINEYRRSNGLGELRPSITLTRAAQFLSEDMASKNYFSHTEPSGRGVGERLNFFNYPTSLGWGENIAAGYPEARDTLVQWRNSPPHNSNMLAPALRVIGIGRNKIPQGTYRYYWTTDFGVAVDALIEVPYTGDLRCP